MAGTGEGAARAILYALGANTGIALAKTGAAIYTGSSSMLAEAIHSFADAGNQLLLLLGIRRSRRPPDEEHPLGYGKVVYFWSFIVAILLFSVGGLFSIHGGWRKLQDPGESLENIGVALFVLALAIALEGISMRTCMVEVNRIRGDRSLRDWLRESRSSELIVIFGEDSAALLGLVIAFVFVAMAGVTGDPRYDAYGSIAIGVLLVVVSTFIATLIRALLIGRSANPDVVDAIERAIVDDPSIERVFNVITIQVGPQVMLAAKIRLSGELHISEACDHINRLEARLKRQIPEIGWCFVEPDLSD